jgi:repressor LexA
MKTLTDKQQFVLERIHEFLKQHSYPPTLQELSDIVGVKSKNAIVKHLTALEKKGYIHKEGASARGLKIINYDSLDDEPDMEIQPQNSIPLLGRVAAGLPILAQENIDRFVAIPDHLVSSNHQYFALRVHGDSMIDAGIFNFDIVIVKKVATANINDIVVALINDEATVKRLKQTDQGYYLKAENEHYDDIFPQQDWSIQGVVVGLIRDQML